MHIDANAFDKNAHCNMMGMQIQIFDQGIKSPVVLNNANVKNSRQAILAADCKFK